MSGVSQINPSSASLSVIPSIHALPRDVLITIFQKLDFNNLRRAANVCKLWNNVIYDPTYKSKLTVFFNLRHIRATPSPTLNIVSKRYFGSDTDSVIPDQFGFIATEGNKFTTVFSSPHHYLVLSKSDGTQYEFSQEDFEQVELNALSSSSLTALFLNDSKFIAQTTSTLTLWREANNQIQLAEKVKAGEGCNFENTCLLKNILLVFCRVLSTKQHHEIRLFDLKNLSYLKTLPTELAIISVVGNKDSLFILDNKGVISCENLDQNKLTSVWESSEIVKYNARLVDCNDSWVLLASKEFCVLDSKTGKVVSMLNLAGASLAAFQRSSYLRDDYIFVLDTDRKRNKNRLCIWHIPTKCWIRTISINIGIMGDENLEQYIRTDVLNVSIKPGKLQVLTTDVPSNSKGALTATATLLNFEFDSTAAAQRPVLKLYSLAEN